MWCSMRVLEVRPTSRPIRRRGAYAIVLAVLLSIPGAAHARQGPLRVVGAVDVSHITEDDGFLGVGAGVGGGLEIALSDRTTLGVDVSVTRHVRDLGLHAVAFDPGGLPTALPITVRWEGNARFGLVTLAHAFGASSLRPVIWAGVGLMSHGGTSGRLLTQPQVPPGYILQDVGTFDRQGRAVSAFVVEGGGGVDIAVSSRVAVRPFGGLRLAQTDNVGPKYILRAGARIAVGW